MSGGRREGPFCVPCTKSVGKGAVTQERRRRSGGGGAVAISPPPQASRVQANGGLGHHLNRQPWRLALVAPAERFPAASVRVVGSSQPLLPIACLVSSLARPWTQ